MTRLSLPITSDPKQTLLRWGAELRRFLPLGASDYEPKTYAPELTSASGTLSLVTVNQAIYIKPEPVSLCTVFLSMTFDLAGSATNSLTATLPFPAANFFPVFDGTQVYTGLGTVNFDGSRRPAEGRIVEGTNQVLIRVVPTTVAITTGAGRNFDFTLQYLAGG